MAQAGPVILLNKENCPIVNLLETTLVEHLVKEKHRNIVVIDENTPIEEAIKTLAEHQILSLPVRAHDSADIVGMVDVLDIINFLIRTYSQGETIMETQWSDYCRDIQLLVHRGIRFGIKPVKSVMGTSTVDPVVVISEKGTIMQLIEQAFSKGIHRVPVMNDINRTVSNIVSQSDVIDFISRCAMKKTNLGILEGKTLADLNLGTKNVITMSVNAQAIHAFYLMFYHKVSAVAIVDESEQLVLNLSASEIRGLDHKNFDALLLPITEFMHKMKLIPSAFSLRPPLTCLPTTTLETAIFRLATYRVHRLWIVDEQGRPVGVLSLTDIMKLFLPAIEADFPLTSSVY